MLELKPLRDSARETILGAERMTTMSETISDRAIARIQAEMMRQHLSQRDIGNLLKWPQSRVSKLLAGQIALGLDDLASFAFALSLSPVELIRDHGLEFCAEMTPTELRTLERLRALDELTLNAFLLLLDAKRHAMPDRYALKPKSAAQKRKRNA